MEPKQREQLMLFLASLPAETELVLLDKNLDIFILLNELCGIFGFPLAEMGNICAGVRKVLAGEDSASNLVAFIQQDEQIEEDNRPKIPALAYEIQQKIFDPVLPILKQAGFPIKEGRVPQATTPISNSQFPISNEQKGVGLPQLGTAPTTPSSVSVPRSVPSQFSASLDERNIRALTRIAAGTKYSEEELRETFEELPVGLRQSLSSVDTANTIEEVAKKHLLHVDQMAALASETGLVLLGLTHLADFVANLAKRLRLPEDQAKEIARDISAEIFVKVRDALRGIHEAGGNPKSQAPNPKQIPSSNIQNIKQGTTPAVSEYGTPFGKGELKSSELNANRSTLTASSVTASSTPYSPQAKWNTGINQQPTANYPLPTEDNILARQARLKESLTREEVLRGIENPKSTYKYTNGTNIRMNANKAGVARAEEGGTVRPTGWKAQQNEIRTMKYEPAGRPIQQQTPVQPQRLMPTPPAPPKSRPQSEGAFPPTQPKHETDDFLDQKLQSRMTAPREERRYTTDPYREPME